MINIDMVNTIKQRVEYSRDLDEESIKAVLDIIEQVEADILDIIEGAVEHEESLGLDEASISEFEEEDVINWVNFRGAKEDSLDENFRPKRDPNFYALDQFNFAE